jgi:leucyl/phenylalanyl-tRNA---protein transferase
MPEPQYEFASLGGLPGLVGVGGTLDAEALLKAYRRGVFPWFNEGDPVLWWCPDPRAVLPLDDFHVPSRLARTLRSGKFTCTLDREFAAVVRGCATRLEGTWITPELARAYEELHEQGQAHSVEAWHEGRLAGGVFGVALGGFFTGESMFHRVRDASNVALAWLVVRLRVKGFVLFDLQVLTAHTARLGGREIPRDEYLRRLRLALACDVSFRDPT